MIFALSDPVLLAIVNVVSVMGLAFLGIIATIVKELFLDRPRANLIDTKLTKIETHTNSMVQASNALSREAGMNDERQRAEIERKQTDM